MPLNIDSMQQEAMRRVQEMHSRAYNAPRRAASQTSPQQASPVSSPRTETAVPETHEQVQEQSIPRIQNENRVPTPESSRSEGGNLLETVFHDKERSLIMLLILILANENTKPEALLALMYLVM